MDVPRTVLALIPARGGSRAIPRKNIREFCGKPLIAHTILAARGSSLVDRVVVSTDDEEIATVAREYDAQVPVLRPAQLAADTSPVMDAVVHMLDHLKNSEGYAPTHVLLLQTTSPLRQSADIDASIELLEKSGADSLVSMCRTEQGLYCLDERGFVETLFDGYSSSNRQELRPTYKLDGSMIYLLKTDVLLKERSFLAGSVVAYEVPRWRAVDLDEPQDFVVGELIARNLTDVSDAIRNFS